MGIREKGDVFEYRSGSSQGILIHVLGMSPVYNAGYRDGLLSGKFSSVVIRNLALISQWGTDICR